MTEDQIDSARVLKKAKQVIQQAELNRKNGILSAFSADCDALLQGDGAPLEKKAFAAGLSELLVTLYSQGNTNEFEKYILQLKKALRFSSVARENILLLLSVVSQQLPDSAPDFYLVQLISLSLQFLRVETRACVGLGAAFSQMKRICVILLMGDAWKNAATFLERIAQIQQGLVEKEPRFTETVKKLQDNIATKEVLARMAGICLAGDEEDRKVAVKLLVFLGRRAVIFLVNMLNHAQSQNEQERLIKILSGWGRDAYPVFNDCLGKTKSPPIINRIIKIYEASGDDNAYIHVRPYLSHKDISVQQNVVQCIAVFDKKRAKARILEAVEMVYDDLKPQLVMQLGTYDGEDVEQCLLEIIENRSRIAEHVAVKLLGITCLALKGFPDENSTAALLELKKELQSNAKENRYLLYIIENVLNLIVPIQRHTMKGTYSLQDGVVYEPSFDQKTSVTNLAKTIEEEAVLLIDGGQTEKATEHILEQIKKLAKKRDFVTAQYLQNKMLSLNPMALEEVIEAEEYIETQKFIPSTAGNLVLLEEFQKHFSADDCNALLDCLNIERYEAGELIVQSGEIDPCLYFVDSGIVNVECTINGRTVFLKKLKEGDAVGVGTFFSCAVWTYTMVANIDSELHVLSRKKYNELLARNPAFDQTFYQFCGKFDILADLIKIAGNDRRDYPRYRIARTVQCRMLDMYGQAGKKRYIKGDVIDMSSGGIAFTVSVSEKINPMLLLGKMVDCTLPTSSGRNSFSRMGTIVAAKDLKSADKRFSLHVKFQDALQQNEITALIK